MAADTPLIIAARANARMADLIEWLSRDPSTMGNVTRDRLADVLDEMNRLAKACDFDIAEERCRL